jgi:hypothetical protein
MVTWPTALASGRVEAKELPNQRSRDRFLFPDPDDCDAADRPFFRSLIARASAGIA